MRSTYWTGFYGRSAPSLRFPEYIIIYIVFVCLVCLKKRNLGIDKGRFGDCDLTNFQIWSVLGAYPFPYFFSEEATSAINYPFLHLLHWYFVNWLWSEWNDQVNWQAFKGTENSLKAPRLSYRGHEALTQKHTNYMATKKHYSWTTNANETLKANEKTFRAPGHYRKAAD